MTLHEPLRPTAGPHVSLIHLFSRASQQQSCFNASFNWRLHKDLRSCRQSKRPELIRETFRHFQSCRFILKHLNRAESDINLSQTLPVCTVWWHLFQSAGNLLSAGTRQLAEGKACSCLNNALSACNMSQAPVIMTPLIWRGQESSC